MTPISFNRISMLMVLVLSTHCVGAAVIKVTNAKQLTSQKKPRIVKFYGSWCHVCKEIETAYNDLSQDSSCSDIAFCEVDVDKMPELSKQYKIKGVPTFVYLDKDNKNIHEVIGVSNIKKFKEERQKEIEQVFGKRGMVAKLTQGVKDSYQYVAHKTKSLFGMA